MQGKMHRKSQRGIRLLLTGGGTGGHVYPLLAIHRIVSEGIGVERTLYVGTKGRAEEKIVPRTGIPMKFVSTAPVAGMAPWSLIPALWSNLVGTLQAVVVLLRFRPHLIIASGGYVSAPVCFASFLSRPFLRAPLVIDEQNVMPGLMNKVASLIARVVMVSFPESPYFLWNNRCVYTGYPVREEVTGPRDTAACRRRLGVREETFVVLVYGGSLGSRSINRMAAGLVPGLLETKKRLLVVHSTGLARGEYDAWADTEAVLRAACPRGTVFDVRGEALEASLDGGRVRYRLEPYLHEIGDSIAAADLVVCRAGAGAVTEICGAGKASILIPKRGLPGDHQEHNAIRLAQHAGCEVVFERQDSGGVDVIDQPGFFEVFRRLLETPERLEELGRNAHSHFYARFRQRIDETVRAVLERRDPEYMPDILEPGSVRILKQVDGLVSFLRRQPPDSFYRRLYSIKMDEYFASPSWLRVNDAIKLAGALRRLDRIPDLLRCFREGKGFMRRNVLRAFDHFDGCQEALPPLLMEAFDDSYFEVRATAVSVAGKYASDLSGNAAIVDSLRRLSRRRLQHYDVRLELLRVLPLFLPLEEYFSVAGRFRFAENARLRQAILDGLRQAFEAGRIQGAQVDATRRFIDEMPITTSDFRPQFVIRGSFLQLYQKLAQDRIPAPQAGNGRDAATN
jgi:UDP-N-acetylglucosamine--N-acetylmuramyl-(pentapeptide) pyrophosphoryl-undecaprenol N-acetylglucosamine transferase